MLNFTIEVNLSTQKSTEQYGGMAFFLENLQDYLPYSILSAFATLVGILGKNKKI